MRHRLNRIGGGALPLLPALERLPVCQNLLAVIRRHGSAKNMGMAVHQLLCHTVHYVRHRKPAALRFHLSVQRHLHQNIPQLLAHVMGIIPIYGIQRLIGLL